MMWLEAIIVYIKILLDEVELKILICKECLIQQTKRSFLTKIILSYL